MTEDLRQDDIDFLQEYSLSDGHFGEIWEKELHKIKSSDRNQERWHLSRMSMLAGYLIGQGKSMEEVLSIVSNHRKGGGRS